MKDYKIITRRVTEVNTVKGEEPYWVHEVIHLIPKLKRTRITSTRLDDPHQVYNEEYIKSYLLAIAMDARILLEKSDET